MTEQSVILGSLSGAMDGGFVAIADTSDAMIAIGASDDNRLMGGVAVLLHVQRLGLDLPLRATGDADFGVPLQLLRNTELVAAIEALGYTKVAGNRWERCRILRRCSRSSIGVSSHKRPRPVNNLRQFFS